MAGNKVVSVIMPCYNDGAYIEEAVASVRSQSYPCIELIIIDDGSDSIQTKEILEKLKKGGITVIHTNREGPSGARNSGIAAANGEYILPLDADDKIESVYIEKAVDIIEKNPKTGIVYCLADLFGEKTGLWKFPKFSIKRMLLSNLIFVTALYRKSDWTRVGGYSTKMESGLEDYDFWLSLLELGRDVYQIPEILFHYRIKTKSRTQNLNGNDEALKETYRQLYKNHIKLYKKYNKSFAIRLQCALACGNSEKGEDSDFNEKKLSSKAKGKIALLLKQTFSSSSFAFVLWRCAKSVKYNGLSFTNRALWETICNKEIQ